MGQPQRVRRARGLQRMDAILDAAENCFARRGYDESTTNHIAVQAGISPGSLYQYFANRDEILIALADREQQRVAERMRTLIGQIELGDGLDSARAFIQALVRSIRRRRGAKRSFALIAALRDSGRMPALGDEFAAVLEETWNRLGDGRGPLARRPSRPVRRYQ